MNERFVTVATFPDPALAHLAKTRLEEAGIPAFVAGEHFGSVLTAAMQWPSVQVARDDALRAIAVLESHGEELPDEDEIPSDAFAQRDRFVGGEEPEQDLTGPDHDEEEPPAHDVRRPEAATLADRALKSALLGIAFWPILGYAVYLLISLLSAPEPLSPREARRAWMTVGVLALMAFFIGALFYRL